MYSCLPSTLLASCSVLVSWMSFSLVLRLPGSHQSASTFTKIETEYLLSLGVSTFTSSKPGFLPLINIGSATATDLGLRARFKDYRLLHTTTSQPILDAINDGYVLGHGIVLAHCPIPQPADQPLIRAVCPAFEAGFSAIFWCMLSKTNNYGHLGDSSIWDREELPWGGLCTHSPLIESCKGQQLTPGQLDAIAEERRIYKNTCHRAWSKADNAKKRANPTPEFAAQRTKINKSKYKNKKRDAAVANKIHNCESCEKCYTSATELEKHRQTPLHRRRNDRGEKNFSCAPCGISYPNKSL
jgi:hypothetical protein